MSATSRSISGTFNIGSSISITLHTFIWLKNSDNFNNQAQNKYVLNTYAVGGASVEVSLVQLNRTRTTYYLLQALRPQAEVVRTYHNLIENEKGLNDVKPFESCVEISFFKSP